MSSSGRTLGKLLLTWSIESSIGLPPQSDRARAPAIEGDGGDDQGAEQELYPVGIDLGEHQPILDQSDDEDRKDCSDDRYVAAGKRGAADDGGGEREQQPVAADQRLGRAELGDGEHGSDRGQKA